MTARPRMRTVRVDLGSRGYPIRIGSGTLPQLGGALERLSDATRVAVVTVPPVGRRYARGVLASLEEAGFEARRFEVPDGDASKNPDRVAALYDGLLAASFDRGDLVLALGGGMVGDLAGFVAATYLRGVDFVQVPTTVLAMVDSSIGGKVGINLPQGKNLVGAFHQPKLVWTDVATLETLPARQRAAGLAEVVKAAVLWDERLFDRLERDLERVLALQPEALIPVLERACAIKAEIVARDERESGLRMLLNFGHTLGHAVEKIHGYQDILHGEAVSMGMVFAARRSEQLELAPAGRADRIAALLRRADLPTELPDHPRKAYLEALRVDKKKRDAHIRFVVMREIGRTQTVPLAPAEILPPRWKAVG